MAESHLSTEEAIKEAFMRLLEKKSYDDITIKLLCKEANVSPKTFYKYFEGKQAIIKQMLYDDISEPMHQIRALLPVLEMDDSTELLLGRHFQNLYDHRDLYINLIEHYGQENFSEDLRTVIYELNQITFADVTSSPLELDYIATAFAASGAATDIWWLKEHPEISPQEISQLYNTWCFGSFRELMTQGLSESRNPAA